MSYAKKMVLVEPRQIEKYKETMLDKTLSKLDGELYEILHRNISDDEKAKLYSNSLSRYLNINKPDIITKFNAVDTNVDTVPETDSAQLSTDIETLVLDSVPQKWKLRASRLLKHIKNNPQVGWSEKGELILQNNTIPNTHVIDLVNDLMRKRTSARTPNGWKQLADVLKDHNVPHELIGNMDRWNYINQSSDSVDSVTPNTERRTTSERKRRRKRFNWAIY